MIINISVEFSQKKHYNAVEIGHCYLMLSQLEFVCKLDQLGHIFHHAN
jgi:hypothetical protein